MTERKKPSQLRTEGAAKIISLPDLEPSGDTPPGDEAPKFEDMKQWLRKGADIAKLPPTRWLLPHRMPKAMLTAIYAAPKGGKTFVANELAIEAATGGSFWGEDFTRPLKVLYIAAERASDVRDRIEASCKRRGISFPETLHLLARGPGAPQVLSHKHFEGMKELAAAERYDLIIFDTYAQMTQGMKENASDETGVAVAQFLAIIHAAGDECAGFIVHHSGKDEAKGLRGSTALLAAVAATWRVTKSGERFTLSVEAINAGTPPLPCYFTVTSEQLEPAPGDDEPREVGVLSWQDYAQVAQDKDRKLIELLEAEGEKGLSASEMALEYSEATGETAKAATVGRWLSKLHSRGGCERRGEKKAARYYAKRDEGELF
jgi:hypothetical protein